MKSLVLSSNPTKCITEFSCYSYPILDHLPRGTKYPELVEIRVVRLLSFDPVVLWIYPDSMASSHVWLCALISSVKTYFCLDKLGMKRHIV